AVHKQLKELRTGRVLIDWSQNDQYKTTVNVYSLRARARPTVSTPVSWDEVEKCLKAKDPSLLVFDSDQVLKRVEKLGDLFYQVASALLDPGEIARPVRQLIRPLRNVDFLQASINGVDFAARCLRTDHGPIPYDYLVLATGAQSDYFGNRSIAEHTLGLKDLD